MADLAPHVQAHPLREGPRAQLMLALYRTARPAEALAVYQEGHTAMVEELGLEPGARLRRLQDAILTRDPVLDLAAPPIRSWANQSRREIRTLQPSTGPTLSTPWASRPSRARLVGHQAQEQAGRSLPDGLRDLPVDRLGKRPSSGSPMPGPSPAPSPRIASEASGLPADIFPSLAVSRLPRLLSHFLHRGSRRVRDRIQAEQGSNGSAATDSRA
jgi:hypothetical protein